jgi:hypothetical protein
MQGDIYVDKSGFISGVLQSGADVQLYPRPRRFGKTLNLSMLRYFFEAGPDKSSLFEGLVVWQDAAACKHFQQYPVIYLSFKTVKHRSWPEALASILSQLTQELERQQARREQASPLLKASLQAIAVGQGSPTETLFLLSKALHQVSTRPVVILIDEYDAPLLTAWEHGYFEDAIAWFRSFLSAGLKDNPYLFRGVLTGVLRISRESLFSDLNNIIVYSLLDQRSGSYFGFLPEEVERLLEEFRQSSALATVQHWYNGYRFGMATVYNPWSILQFLARPEAGFRPYWLNSSENGLIRSLLLENVAFQPELETLLRGGTIEKEIEENITLWDLHSYQLWNFLLFSGYLRADQARIDERGRHYVSLGIPNWEVRMIWEDSFSGWLETGLGSLEPLHRALLTGDAATVQALLETLLLRHVSTWDLKSSQDEAFYHAFVLGLLVTLEKTHAVRSNRETGKGRADVLVAPKERGKPGVILEFKKLEKGRTLEGMAEEALRQVEKGAYAVDLQSLGAEPIWAFGVSLAGKEVVVVGRKDAERQR